VYGRHNAMLLSVQVLASSPLPLFGKMIVSHKFRLDTAGTGESTNYGKSTQVVGGFPVPLFGKEGLGEICRAYAAPFIELEWALVLKKPPHTTTKSLSIPLFQRGRGNCNYEASASTPVSSQQVGSA
jgi:hypothetical protein